MANESLRHEQYRHSEQFTREVMAARTGQDTARFLVPFLTPGMDLLDCGCGQGNITIDLAELVAPGRVVGVDQRDGDLARARELAAVRNVANVTFQTASIYKLPFPDACFDAASAHHVLVHLADPVAALREIRRVLRPGGIVGIVDATHDRTIRTPTNSLLERWQELQVRARLHNGGSPGFAPTHRACLRAAGFARAETHAIIGGPHGADAAGTAVLTRQVARSHLAILQEMVRPVAVAQGWAEVAELDAMGDALMAWGEDPDACWMTPICCSVGWA